MRLGYTGTREGMTIIQWEVVQELILEKLSTAPRLSTAERHWWHDGDCVGGDTQSHNSVRELKKDYGFNLALVGHPCNLSEWRAYNEYDVTHEIKAPLQRNRDIVDAVNLMFAGPKQYDEVKRGSGTWGTIRYARLKQTPLIIVWPDGSVTRERGA